MNAIKILNYSFYCFLFLALLCFCFDLHISDKNYFLLNRLIKPFYLIYFCICHSNFKCIGLLLLLFVCCMVTCYYKSVCMKYYLFMDYYYTNFKSAARQLIITHKLFY